MAELKWISVEDRMPENWQEVLVWYEYYHYKREQVLPEYGLATYFKEYGFTGEDMNGTQVKVLAWMPLPEPYKPEGNP